MTKFKAKAQEFLATEHFDPKSEPLEIAKLLGIDWKMKETKAYACDIKKIEIPGTKAVIAYDDLGNKEAIAAYGAKRSHFQNTDLIGFFQNVAKHYNNLPLTAIGKSKYDIYAKFKLPGEINPKEVGDVTEAYLVIYDSRSINTGISFYTYYNRLICTNGMTRRLTVGKNVLAHHSNLNLKKVDQMILNAITDFQSEGQIVDLLCDRPMSIDEASLILIKQFGVPELPIDKQPRIVKTCLSLFDGEGEGSNIITNFQTAYGLLNSVTQYYRGNEASTSQFLKILNGSSADNIRSFEKQLVKVSR